MIKVIKLILAVLIGVLSLLGVLSLNKFEWSNPFKIQSKETTHDIILEKISSLGQLELAQYHFKDIVEQKLVRAYLPDPKALLIVHGEAVGCINLKEITFDDIEVFEDKVVVQLPSPNLCSYKVDHEKSYIYDASNAFMNESELFEEAYKSAEKKIKESALASDILQQTKTNAAILLKPILATISQKEVVFK